MTEKLIVESIFLLLNTAIQRSQTTQERRRYKAMKEKLRKQVVEQAKDAQPPSEEEADNE